MPRRTRPAQTRNQHLATFLGIAACVAALYFAQDVLIPVALAVMLSFLLATPATWLERHRFGRVPSVLIVVLIAAGIVGSLAFVVGQQVVTLAESMANYKDNISKKVETVRGGFGDRFKHFGSELTSVTSKSPATQTTSPTASPVATGAPPAPAPDPLTAAGDQLAKDPVGTAVREPLKSGQPATAPTTQGTNASNPLFVTSVDAPLSPLQVLRTIAEMVLGPLGTAGLVLVFVVFVLLEREGMRDRLIRLVSQGQYTVTTKAINDAAQRITRYLLAQSMVNGTYGIAVAVGLYLIGLIVGHGQSFPSFVLWGLLCAVLRFIPYLGPWMGASFPLVLALAVYPGFHVFIAVLAMFVIIELISNNAMEPWLYGTSTGLSTVAILVAAVFWTWLWGPIGLLLSTPLTVCIVVCGKYVGQLSFLDIMLSDQAALPPSVSYYQRLLAGDRHEALKLTQEVLKAQGRERVADEVFVPALLLARRDRADDALTTDAENDIFKATAQVIDETLRPPEQKKVAKAATLDPAGAGESDATSPSAAPMATTRVLGCPAHHRAEELVLQMLGRLLGTEAGRMEIASTRMLTSEVTERICREKPEVVFIAIVPPGGIVQARFLVRRIRKSTPDVPIVVGYFGRIKDFDRLLNRLRSAGANHVVTSVLQAYRHLETKLGMADTEPVNDMGSRLTESPEALAESMPLLSTFPNGERRPPDGIAGATPPPATAGNVPVIQSTPNR